KAAPPSRSVFHSGDADALSVTFGSGKPITPRRIHTPSISSIISLKLVGTVGVFAHMHIDLLVALAGLVVGFVVGLTGMGGGALMTPMLVLFFGIQPLAAVSSDLVASLVMKP